jgi:hypothetical protein
LTVIAQDPAGAQVRPGNVGHEGRHTLAAIAALPALGEAVYPFLASPTLRSTYNEAIGKVRKLIPLAVGGKPVVPAKVEWIASEYLKTRLAAGYCSRHLAAEACPYANVCETCDNFVPAPEFAPALRSQLDDVRHLQTDAQQRGWISETARHGRVAGAPRGAGRPGRAGRAKSIQIGLRRWRRQQRYRRARR